MIECRTMASAERYDAFALMRCFRDDEAALGDALALFIDRPDYGFVWLAYEDDAPVACVSVAFGLSTQSGGIVATLNDLWVVPERRRRGIGSALLLTLHARLDQLDVVRVESAFAENPPLRAFFAARGYVDERATRVTLDRR